MDSPASRSFILFLLTISTVTPVTAQTSCSLVSTSPISYDCTGALDTDLNISSVVNIQTTVVNVFDIEPVTPGSTITWGFPLGGILNDIDFSIDTGTSTVSGSNPIQFGTNGSNGSFLFTGRASNTSNSTSSADRAAVFVSSGGGNIEAIFDGAILTTTTEVSTALLSNAGAGELSFLIGAEGLEAYATGSDRSRGIGFENTAGRGFSAGAVTLTNAVPNSGATVTVETVGSNSAGIRFLSGGGDGSSSRQSGGNGGSVTVDDVTAMITTLGNGSPGFVADSNGGAGASGSTGGRGGNAATTSVSGAFTIDTSGASSAAFVVKSIGGSGGSGSSQAGSAGRGGATSFDLNSGTIVLTRNDYSPGVAAQSIGGRGGSGTRSAGLVTFGADGGSGGAGGVITIDNTSDGNANSIQTRGNGSDGVLAQSIGGGGGSGGSSFGLFYSNAGQGAQGGAGSSVSYRGNGNISTRGNSSSGIFLQSIGGTGGSGGSAGGMVAIGGRAGAAANAGEISVLHSGGSIATGTNPSGDADPSQVQCAQGCSHGILAQSIGGGGGNGGAAGGWFSVGGGAAGGGNGGVVRATIERGASVTTHLKDSTGIMAQSIGGGGGNGGASISGGLVTSVSVGGSGGNGGTAGSATAVVIDGSNVTTHGDNSHAVMAQSVGGGGGNGGFAATASVAVGLSVSLGVGGSGGGGGSANAASAFVTTPGAVISTAGSDSHGVFAQSVGGGGGNGGFSVAASAQALGFSGALSVGGSGGSGGTGRAARVINSGDIETLGDRSNAMIAQSIGGGGGNGALAVSATVSGGPNAVGASISIGGRGGTGGSSSVVDLENYGALSTSGDDSAAMIGQSISGGGGNGGLSFSGSIGIANAGNVSFSLGGSGGQSRNARATTVINRASGTITTSGARSPGIFAQSVGGGGGNGAVSISTNITTGATASLGAAIGGTGGGGGSGSTVTVTNNGTVTTDGVSSTGLIAQSIGGGGGNGGLAVSANVSLGSDASLGVGIGGGAIAAGDGGSVVVTSLGSISTSSDLSNGILAQSIGGGGGNGGTAIAANVTTTNSKALSASIGGASGLGGSGSNVGVVVNGSVTTEGGQSDGIVAQSIGGGGGNGGSAMSGNLSGGDSIQVGVSVGGSGAMGGRSGDISVVTGDAGGSAEIVATGDGSRGIVAQSIAGGGGNGGNVFSGNFTTADTTKELSVSIGGSAGSSGAAGSVTVDHNGSISTGASETGRGLDGEHGILAQSIAGSGGSGGAAITRSNNTGNRSFSVVVGGRGGNVNVAEAVTVNAAGAITTRGRESHGIFSQSIGGGGGTGGATGTFSASGDESRNYQVSIGGGGGIGNSGAGVTINNDAVISALGSGSSGIVAQSLGGGGGSGGANQFTTTTADETAASGITVGIGGRGSVGGNGGAVDIINSGAIAVGADAPSEDEAATVGYGIFAQSIGGGGGNGGIGIEGDVNLDGNAALEFGLGGSSSGAGEGGRVTVQSSGTIATFVDQAHAISAQSIGGGGGDGGAAISGDIENTADNGLVFGLGGKGGSGGSSAKVTVTVSNNIAVAGDGAKGIFAQSVGGGGGNGAIGIDGDLESSTETSQNQLVLGFGGGSGTAGRGGAVEVALSDAIISTGSAGDDTPSSLGGMDGIFAQSIGGGGGSGGTGIAGDMTSGGDQKAISFGLGGGSGSGTSGGTVTVNTTGASTISVEGQGSRGIFAQSVGGGGGDGGVGIDGSVEADDDASKAIQLELGIGRSGGSGGSGGSVNVDNRAEIFTNASGAGGISENYAIFAQSVGGGGGDGGMGIGGDIETPSESQALNIGIGGGTSAAGAGGRVSVTNRSRATLTVKGNNASGIFAQSVGGGGGTGGAGISGDIGAPDDSKAQKQINLGLGGAGGSGGSGGNVSITNRGTILTEALGEHDGDLHGIFAQSIGGGGGNGAVGVSGDVTGSKDSAAATIAIGSTGGGGGSGASGSASSLSTVGVGIFNNGDIGVTGDGSRGIFAQSIGGGGGNGAVGLDGTVSTGDGKALTFAMGAKGGNGGKGGTVRIENIADLVMTGAAGSVDSMEMGEAHGIFAQSVGGGGGSGNLSGGLVYGDISSSGTRRGVSFSLGSSASGGDGRAVVIQSGSLNGNGVAQGVVRTYNTSSYGIFAQSVGGGGGTGPDFAGIGTIGTSKWTASLRLGATGNSSPFTGSDGKGGPVQIENSSELVETFGDGAIGVFAQSVGGGGGVAGNAPTNTEETRKAIFDINLGSRSLKGGGGGDVTIVQKGGGSVVTSGRYGLGIMAQSVGGGGGLAALGAVGDNDSKLALNSASSNADGGDVSVSLIDGDNVIETSGNGAAALIAQSVGGGGGYSGRVSIRSSDNFGSNLPMGSVNSIGNGGAVDVLLDGGRISTAGAGAVGIFAQSVGGGGGVLGSATRSITPALIGSAGGNGVSGRVRIDLKNGASVTTTGSRSHAIFAQSAGGRGSAATLGTRTVVNIGEGSLVSATGPGSHGVFAQSSGNQTGQIQVTVDEGATVIGGKSDSSESGAGIFVRDGDVNTIRNFGSLSSIEGTVGTAFRSISDGGGTSFENYGSVLGRVVMEGNGSHQFLNFGTYEGAVTLNQSGAGSFENETGGLVISESIQAPRIVNRGTIQIGSQKVISELLVTGALEQTESGTIVVDIDPSLAGTGKKVSDTIVVDGTAVLDGTASVNLLSVYQATGEEVVVPFIIFVTQETDAAAQTEKTSFQQAAAAVSDLELTESIVAQYELVVTSPTEIDIAFDIDFSNAEILTGVTTNQAALSEYIEQLYEARLLDPEIILALINISDFDTYDAALDTLSSEIYADTQVSTTLSALRFSDTLFSCASSEGAYRFFDDGTCVFTEIAGARLSRSDSDASAGFDQDSWRFSAGGQLALGDVWTVGGAFTYVSSDITNSHMASSSTGDQFFIGASLKRRYGNWELSGALGGSYGKFDSRRNPFIGPSVSGDQDVWSGSVRARAAYLIGDDTRYIIPRIEAGLDFLNAGALTETGDSPFRLHVAGSSETYFTLRPAVEFGGEFLLSNGAVVRPHATIGITQFLGNHDVDINSRFASILDSSSTWATSVDIGSTYFDLAAGVDVFTDQGFTFRAETYASLASKTRSYGGSLRLEIPF